jgi:hypothetical protein
MVPVTLELKVMLSIVVGSVLLFAAWIACLREQSVELGEVHSPAVAAVSAVVSTAKLAADAAGARPRTAPAEIPAPVIKLF